MIKILLKGIFCLLLITPLHSKESRISVEWLEPLTTLEQLTKVALQESNIVSDFASMVSTEYKIGATLSMVVGGEGAPAYNENKMTLTIPYSYLAAVVRAQSELVEDRQKALAQGMDMVEYTLYHEFGHVLAADLSVDADQQAEDISTWLMLTHWPNGGEQWFTSIRAFAQASQKLDGPLSDYWHAHSLYKSRQRELECAILGSNPEKFETFMPAVLEPQARRLKCVTFWNDMSNRVEKQLSSLKTAP